MKQSPNIWMNNYHLGTKKGFLTTFASKNTLRGANQKAQGGLTLLQFRTIAQ